MSTLAQLRKLIFGETWTLPLGVGAALGISALVRAIAGPHGWWHHWGGFVLLGLVLVAFVGSLTWALRARR
jgi:hypothetical protein